MDTFKELGLSEEILKALGEIGFETPTEIQKSAIGQLLENERDLMGLAQTGTGKTAAFGLPLLDLMDDTAKYTQAIILAPTRELVQQIAVEMKNFSKYKNKLNISTVYGGTAIMNQIKEIKKYTPHIIIATPGRLIDLIGRRVVKLTDINYLILDEADEMLNMGFQEDIDKILLGTNPDKKTWLFSATMPKEIRHIVNTYMDNPIEVKVDQKNVINQNISHKYVLVNRRDKAEAVKRVLDYIPEFYGVIFCRTKMDTQDLADELARDGYKADAIHGDLSQGQRDKVMKKFRAGSCNIMVATDVAARGIDVNNLTHVIHYTLPDSPAYYTHRSGRTARAGKTGTSLTILIPKDKSKMKQISRALSIDFEKILLPKYAELLDKRIEKWTEKLMEADENDIPKETLDKVLEQLSEVGKDEIVAKLLSQQLKKIRKKNNIQDDLNLDEFSRDGGGGRDRDRGRSRDRDRGDRGDRGGRDRDRGGRDRGRSRDGDRDRGDRKRESKSDGRRDRDNRRDVERSGRRSEDRPDRTDRTERRDRSERGDRRDRPERSERRDRPERGERRDRGDRIERRSGERGGNRDDKAANDGGGKQTKMFINIGKVDKMSPGDLLDFISKNANVKRKAIGDINMSKMHTTFEIDKSEARSVSKYFKNIDYNGRDIRCNED
ncbi:MAG: ATP-dependent RNA helicase DeaD [Saprospiraceae bacterium]